jgi:hypothetical protein
MPNTADTGLQLSPDKRAMVAGKRRATTVLRCWLFYPRFRGADRAPIDKDRRINIFCKNLIMVSDCREVGMQCLLTTLCSLSTCHYAVLRTGFVPCDFFHFARDVTLEYVRPHPLYGACFFKCANATVLDCV